MRPLSLWESERLTMEDSIELTAASLRAHGAVYPHWAVAFSGGKDSTTTVTLISHLIETGRVPAPESLTVLYADTRLELPPLWNAAQGMLAELRRRGVETITVMPPLDDRFYVRMLGRGYPPPNNGFRWCTGLLKIDPMQRALLAVRERAGQKFLTLTGMRLGESAEKRAIGV